MTLWALMNCPSALSVTSTKDSSSRRLSKTEKSVDLWLFHFRQNCWSLAILNWAQDKIQTEKVFKVFFGVCELFVVWEINWFSGREDQHLWLDWMSLATKVRAITLGKIGGGGGRESVVPAFAREGTDRCCCYLTNPTHPLSRSSNLV